MSPFGREQESDIVRLTREELTHQVNSKACRMTSNVRGDGHPHHEGVQLMLTHVKHSATLKILQPEGHDGHEQKVGRGCNDPAKGDH